MYETKLCSFSPVLFDVEKVISGRYDVNGLDIKHLLDKAISDIEIYSGETSIIRRGEAELGETE